MLSHRKLDVSFDLYLDVYINIFLKQFSTLQQSYGHFSGTLTLFRSTFHLEVGFPSNLPPSPFHHQLVFPRIRTPGIAASFPWHISFIIPRCVAPKEYLCARLSRNYRRNHCGPFWSHLSFVAKVKWLKQQSHADDDGFITVFKFYSSILLWLPPPRVIRGWYSVV